MFRRCFRNSALLGRLKGAGHSVRPTHGLFKRQFHHSPANLRQPDKEPAIIEHLQQTISQAHNSASLDKLQPTSPTIHEQIQELVGDNAMSEILIWAWDNPLEAVLSPSHSYLTSFHDFLPWFLAIPIATLVLRLAVYEILKYGNNSINKLQLQNRRAFELAHTSVKRQLQMQEQETAVCIVEKDGQVRIMPSKSMQLEVWNKTVKLRYGGKHKRWNTPALLQFPIWLVTIETLRSMVGTRYGLIGLILHSLGLPVEEGNRLLPHWFEPSMASIEDSPLSVPWILDLTAPAPMGYLSIVLGIFTFLAIRRGTATLRPAEYLRGRPPLERYFWRALPYFGFLLTPMTLQFPSALLLYWITSSAAGQIRTAPIVKWAFSLIKEDEQAIMSSKVRPLQMSRDGLVPPTWLFDRKAKAMSGRAQVLRGPALSNPLGRGARQAS